jgi:hypothetical protein
VQKRLRTTMHSASAGRGRSHDASFNLTNWPPVTRWPFEILALAVSSLHPIQRHTVCALIIVVIN